MKNKIISILSVILSSAFPALFLYFQNVNEMNFSQISIMLLIFLLMGISLLVVFGIIWKDISIGAFAASVFMILLLNFSAIENVVIRILPHARYWHVLPSILVIAGVLLSYLNRKFRMEIAEIGPLVLCLVFGGLTVFNAVLAAPSIGQKILSEDANDVEIEHLELGTPQEVDALPNVYYFILDEYSSLHVMEKYFDYDNSAFCEHLEDKGFSVSYDSHNNSSVTSIIVTNYVNLDYVVTEAMSEAQRAEIRKNSILVQLMREKGYSVVSLGHTNSFIGVSGKQSTTATVGGETVNELLMKTTFLYPLIEDSTNEKVKIIKDAFGYFDNYAKPNEPTFVFTYLILPHQPFMFNANGDITDLENWHNWADKKYYRDQYIFATSQIQNAIDNILAVDEDAVIILQSDHSARYLENEQGESVITFEDKTNFFNAVYYCGESFEEIKGSSGVNTLRMVVNRLFDLDLEVLTDE